MSIAPELLAEQVMGYAVWATELIPTLKPSLKKPYTIAIIPQGPHFYTGLLQAAGCFLLDHQKKRLLVLSQQSTDDKHIIMDMNTYGAILGKTMDISSHKKKEIAGDIGAKMANEADSQLADQIRLQMPFFRMITDIEGVLHLSIGQKVTTSKVKALMNRIWKHKKEYAIAVITNIDVCQSSSKRKADEQKEIDEALQNRRKKSALISIFKDLVAMHRRKPRVIAYVNPKDFNTSSSLTTRYVCAVG